MPLLRKLDKGFYNRKDVLTIAKELLGKIIVTNFDQQFTSCRIVETEAYAGETDKASHAYGGRRTARTEIMFGKPGTAYVYLCYGIHQMFNVVTNSEGIPHAVLIRAAEPLEGIGFMCARAGKIHPDFTLTRGPGNVAKTLGIFTKHTGMSLDSNHFYIAEDDVRLKKEMILSTTRIGVHYAAEDSLLPYRFLVKGNPYVSGPKLKLL
ncbi:MAG TPA: DNA-3-methyladenine glycosylase [Flavitalea sp.]|nr:DNA-3-methyladenine glycosylase [Flavitalea sp.]